MQQYRLFANNQEIGGCSDKKEAIKWADNYSQENNCDVKVWLKNIIICQIKVKKGKVTKKNKEVLLKVVSDSIIKEERFIENYKSMESITQESKANLKELQLCKSYIEKIESC